MDIAVVGAWSFDPPSSEGITTMGTVEKIAAGMGALIAVYLIVANANGSDTVLRGLGQFNTTTIKALQGR